MAGSIFTCATCGGPVSSGGWCSKCDPGRPGGEGFGVQRAPDDLQIPPGGGSTPVRTGG